MKQKLLIFHPTIPPYRVDLFNSLSEAFETKLYLTWINEKTFDYDSIYAQLKFTPEKYLNCWKHLDDNKPDIVLVSEFGTTTIKVLMHRWINRSNYKVISICDDSFNMLSEKNDFSLIHRWARKIVVPHLNELILVEPLSRNWYMINYGKGYFFPIIRSDTKQREIYSRVLSESRNIIDLYNLANKNIFAFVGRFVALKNIPRIIKAFSRLNQKENALVLIGSGEEDSNIRYVAETCNVTPILPGRLEGDSLYAWYNVVDYFILASYQEAFGAVTNEALLAGCYSLVSKRAGSHCLIKEGVNGFTFDPMNVDELQQKMVMAITQYPKLKTLEKVKRNLMFIKYDEAIENLINHLKSL